MRRGITRKSTRLIVILSVAALTLASVLLLSELGPFKKSSASAAINGTLTQNGKQKVLTVWGNNYQMGYAHGYLLSSDIMSLINNFLLDYLLDNSPQAWQKATNIVNTNMNFGEYSEEIRGMYDGMKAKGGNLFIPALNRNLELSDLKVWNAGVEIGVVKTACSSFAAWGKATGGSTIQARNLDFSYDTRYGTGVKNQVVIAYIPNNRNKFVSVIWAGMVGAVSSMNEQGLTLTANISNGNGVNDLTNKNLVPIPLAFRKVMETKSTSGNLLTDAWSVFTTMPRSRSFNSQWSVAYTNGNQDTSWVVEADATGQVTRKPVNDEAYVYTTNHFLLKRSASPPTQSSLSRYNRMKTALPYLLTVGDKKIDTKESVEILKNLAESTVQSVVFLPNSKSLDVYFGQIGTSAGNLTDAPYTTPVHYNLNDLFNSLPTSNPSPSDNPSQTPEPTPVGHLITIVNKPNSSSQSTIGIDSFVVDGKTIEETDTSLNYSSNWTFTGTNIGESNRRVALTSVDGASVSLRTSASRVVLNTGGGPGTGTIKIYIDNILKKSINTYSVNSTFFNEEVYP